MKKIDRKAKALLAVGDKNSLSDLIGARYSLSDLIDAGYSASDLRGASYCLSDLRGAGYSASALRGAGYSASALIGAGYCLSALRDAGYSASDLRGAGYSASALRGAGYSASALRGAGYSASALIGAGYCLSALRDAGYSASDLRGAGYSASALRDAGYSASDLREIEDCIGELPKLTNPYTTLLKDIQEKKRIHNQSTFGEVEEFDPNLNVCGTPMCTAGQLVNMAGEAGYRLKKLLGWAGAATQIHLKAHPDYPCQNFGPIPQDWAIAYIEEAAEMEANEEKAAKP